MAGYVDLAGVQTWYDELGQGEPLVLLHPGMADSRAFDPNIDALKAHFHVLTPDRRAHGRTPDVEGPITYELMAEDMINFIEKVVGEAAHLVGCSDGTVVGLMTALARPDLARKVVCVCGVFHRDGWVPGAADLSDEDAEFLGNFYAEVSPDGPEHFPIFAAKMDVMHAAGPTLTEAELGKLPNRTLVMIGDDDEVTLEHAAAFYRSIPNSELAIVPGTSHGLLVEKPELCNKIIVDFLVNDPVATYAPIRRASGS